MSLGGAMCICLLNCDLVMGFCLLDHGFFLPNGGCMSDFCLFDGLGSLVLILVTGDVGALRQFSLAGVQDGSGHEQPLQGLVHHPLHSKHLIR